MPRRLARAMLPAWLLAGASVAGSGCLDLGLLPLPQGELRAPGIVIDSYRIWWGEPPAHPCLIEGGCWPHYDGEGVLHVDVSLRNVGTWTPSTLTESPEVSFGFYAVNVTTGTNVFDVEWGGYTLLAEAIFPDDREREVPTLYYGQGTRARMNLSRPGEGGTTGLFTFEPGLYFNFTIMYKPPPEFVLQPDEGYYLFSLGLTLIQPRSPDEEVGPKWLPTSFNAGCVTFGSTTEYYNEETPIPEGAPECLSQLRHRVNPPERIPFYEHLMQY